MSENFTTVLEKDWFGAPVAARPAFALRLEGGDIVFEARVPKPALTVPGDTGGFVEGLWEGDCAELFLVNPETGYYCEFNLSPRGAWWCCTFSSPRVRAGVAELPGVTTSGEGGADYWRSEIRIPVASLPTALAFDSVTTCGNVTFCLGNDPQRYLTWADLGGGNPDFHRPGRWPALFAGK